MTIATTILDQLGGSKFVAMTGARGFVSGARSLSFSLPRGTASNGANRVIIELDARDEYSVRFLYLGTMGAMRQVGDLVGVQAGQLAEAFTRETGLATRL